MKNRLLLLSLILSCFFVADASCATLVQGGKPVAVVASAPDPDKYEKQAVEELIANVEKISGAKLETAVVAAADVESFAKQTQAQNKTAVFVGRNVYPALVQQLGAHKDTRGAFALVSDKNSVKIAGNGEGTYYGVIELLEQQGVRWFFPGPLGEVVPTLKTIRVKEQATAQAPSFPARHFQMPHTDWQQRLRCGGEFFGGGHGIVAPPYAYNSKTEKYEPGENAEYYSLLGGKRIPAQHCVSNPKLIEYVANRIKESRKNGQGPVIPLGPNDGSGFCECPNCKALDAGDYDALAAEMSVTDRYIWFYNRVLEKVLPEYPDTKVAFYIYHCYMRPPLREKPHPHIQGALAPITLDRVHGFSNPIAEEKQYVRTLYQQWGKLMPELFDRGYWSNLADPGFTFILVHRLRDEIPASHGFGLKGFRVETFPNYGPEFPSMYVAGKLMWNHQADVDALLKDCYEKFFGPAAKPMGEYVTMMDAALRDGKYFTGCAWDTPHFYPPALRAKARTLLQDAERRAQGKGIYEQRVQMIDETFEMTDAFCNMMEGRVRNDFATAQAELVKTDAAAKKLMDYKPVPMLSPNTYYYMNLFYRGATEQAFKRTNNGNRLVVAAPDEWQFREDKDKTGEANGWWKSDTSPNGWRPLKTTSQSWSNQGLRYYKGLAWYRQTLEVPAELAGQRIFLWCGGVDETAKVWVNGEPIGVSHGIAFEPFELDATKALKPGKNVITFEISNVILDELGTGGIVAPVFLYAPAKGADAALENTRPLKSTFP